MSGQSASVIGMFTFGLDFFGLALPCIAFAWDGLVRRRALVSPFPRGAALGGQSLLLKRVAALLVGVIALLLALVFLFIALISFKLVFLDICQNRLTFACVGTLTTSVPPVAGWLFFGISVGWFVLVWLLLGNPYQRVFVTGMWYYQNRAAHQVQRALAAQGMEPLSEDNIFQLEERLLRVMRLHHWLPTTTGRTANGTIHPMPSTETLLGTTLREPMFKQSSPSEQAAIAVLLAYFLTLAKQAERHPTALKFVIGRLQLAKGGSYGGRAL